MIVFSISSLFGGGAQTLVRETCERLTAKHIPFGLFLHSPSPRDIEYLGDAVFGDYVFCCEHGSSFNHKVRAFRSFIDLVQDEFDAIIVCHLPKASLIACLSRIRAWHYVHNSYHSVRVFKRVLLYIFYYLLNNKIFCSADLSKFFSRMGLTTRGKSLIIQNPIFRRVRSDDLSIYRFSRPYICALGSLARKKRYDVLIKSYKLSSASKEFDLRIWGTGPERHRLECLRSSLGLEGRVHFEGWTDNPSGALLGSKLLVISSDSEGFPMNILEALHLKIPVVSTDCPTGPREILGSDSFLCPPSSPIELSKLIDSAVFGVLESNYISLFASCGRFSEELYIQKLLSIHKP